MNSIRSDRQGPAVKPYRQAGLAAKLRTVSREVSNRPRQITGPIPFRCVGRPRLSANAGDPISRNPPLRVRADGPHPPLFQQPRGSLVTARWREVDSNFGSWSGDHQTAKG